MVNILPDYRAGGRLTLVATEAKRLMRINDGMKKSVAFVAVRDDTGKIVPRGTAFGFRYLPDWPAVQDQNAGHPYFVTARHVIFGAKGASKDGVVYLKINTRGGGPRHIATRPEQWLFHPTDPAVDVAAFPLLGLPEEAYADADWDWIDNSWTVNDQIVRYEGLGIGDETVVVGLFASHAGKNRNIPIVRIGSIAAMPEEKVAAEHGDIDAYLVEVRSIGGLSGSPVFSAMGPIQTNNLGMTRVGWAFNFLGLVHGHWNLDVEPTANADQAVADAFGKERMNQGIAMVVPAYRILEVLDQPSFLEMRKAWDAAERAANGATAD